MSLSFSCARNLTRFASGLPRVAQQSLLLRPVFRHNVARQTHRRLYARNASTRSKRSQPDIPLPKFTPIQPMQPGHDPSGKIKPSRIAPFLLSFLAIGLGLYTGQLVVAALAPCTHPGIQDLANQKDVAARYDETADSFDTEVGFSEAFMGINGIRKRLSRQCKGDVLEVSCGTGRNLGYYDLSPKSAIDSLTFLDLSPQMVEVCKKKWSSLYPSSSSSATNPRLFKPNLAIRFTTASALNAMPLAPGDKKYTTIIQTMGLCSTPSPHELLTNIAKHLDTSDPDARVFLLEHGRSSAEWLNRILDKSAMRHAEIHGCWFNRDIGELVQTAADASGLEIVTEQRKHFGTTWIYELKPSTKVVASETSSGDSAAAQETAAPAGWWGWLGMK